MKKKIIKSSSPMSVKFILNLQCTINFCIPSPWSPLMACEHRCISGCRFSSTFHSLALKRLYRCWVAEFPRCWVVKRVLKGVREGINPISLPKFCPNPIFLPFLHKYQSHFHFPVAVTRNPISQVKNRQIIVMIFPLCKVVKVVS